jgi:regulatory protein
MKITAVRHYKGSVYEVEIDEDRKLYLHADIIADFGIYTGMETERTELKKIIYASNYRRAFEYALHLLDYRDYSSHEMRQKLIKTYKNESLCEAVMKKLEKIGVINDERYAGRLAEKLVVRKLFGLRRARQEMVMKGLDRFTVEDALAPYTESTAVNLACLLEKKYSRLLTDESDRKSIEKVKNALVRYGYGFEDINRAVRTYFNEADND